MGKRNFVPAHGAKLLRKVAKHILAEPLRYDQNTILRKGQPGSKYGPNNHKYPACGTVACIGGWLEVITERRSRDLYSLDFKRLARLLGVKYDNISRLMAYTTNIYEAWPEQFADAYNDAKTPAQKARIGAARIEHFIKTGL